MLGCDVISDGDTTSVQRQGVGASVTANAQLLCGDRAFERHMQTKLQGRRVAPFGRRVLTVKEITHG